MKDDRKRFFQVIQGKLPSEREMRNKIPKQFSDLKKRLEAVQDIDLYELTIVKQYFADFYADGNHEHMVFPGMVYISHPTEYGTLYSKKELEELEIYNILNNEMEGLIKQAEYVKYYKEHPEEKHIGKEPGE